MKLKKLAFAALALALVPVACQAPLRSAHAAAEGQWRFSFHSCAAIKDRDPDAEPIQITMLRLDDVRELEKLLPHLKRCSAFWQCIEDRDNGKVRHCYENDRRWR
jgi:hypothetical protein